MIHSKDIVKEKHGSCDIFFYKGVKALQVYGVDKAFSVLAKYKKPRVIIEIGADYGGLTNMLADHEICDNAIIHSFDINKQRFRKVANRLNKIRFYHVDVFKYQNLVISIIKKFPGETLVLCDGGNKAEEWKLFSKHLSKGDIIMAHDYAADQDSHSCNIESGRWNWWEFNDSYIDEHGFFKPLMCFDDYVWCIREKL